MTYTTNVQAPNGETFGLVLSDENDIEALRAAGFEINELIEVIAVDAWVMGILMGGKYQ